MAHYVIYTDHTRQWRWRYIARNGRIIAVSSESYVSRADCEHSINLVKGSAHDPVIEGNG